MGMDVCVCMCVCECVWVCMCMSVWFVWVCMRVSEIINILRNIKHMNDQTKQLLLSYTISWSWDRVYFWDYPNLGTQEKIERRHFSPIVIFYFLAKAVFEILRQTWMDRPEIIRSSPQGSNYVTHVETKKTEPIQIELDGMMM